jgi:hypothetical protein
MLIFRLVAEPRRNPLRFVLVAAVPVALGGAALAAAFARLQPYF